MNIRFESNESLKEKAYNAGYDFAKGLSDESTHSSDHFITKELSDEWCRGYEDGEK